MICYINFSLYSSPSCLAESGILCWPMCFPAYFYPGSFWCDFCHQGYHLHWGFLPCTTTWTETTNSFSLLGCSPERQWLLTAAKADLTCTWDLQVKGFQGNAETRMVYSLPECANLVALSSFGLNQTESYLFIRSREVMTANYFCTKLAGILNLKSWMEWREGPNNILKYCYIHLHLRKGSWIGRDLNT